MKRNKILVAALVAALLISCLSVSALAETEVDSNKAYVTIADGELKLVREPVALEDADGDSAITICDALILAHEAKYDGGAASGFGTAEGDYGKYITRLWGDESGSYSYFINNGAVMNLSDSVKGGDYIAAFIYADKVGYSDVYGFFNLNETEVESDSEITLTLSSSGYDAEWNLVENPVAGAKITFNGEDTDYITDENGSVTLSFDKVKGESCVVSAETSEITLVPPVCVVTIAGGDDGINPVIWFAVAAAVIIALGTVVFTTKKHNGKSGSSK